MGKQFYFRHPTNGPMGQMTRWFGSAPPGSYKRNHARVIRQIAQQKHTASSGKTLISLYKGVPAICDAVYFVDCSERVENSWNIVIDK